MKPYIFRDTSAESNCHTKAYTYSVPCLLQYVFISERYLFGYDWEIWIDYGSIKVLLASGRELKKADAEHKADEAYKRLKPRYIKGKSGVTEAQS